MTEREALRQRQRKVLAGAIERGERLYDPEFGLCQHAADPDAPAERRRYTGHFTAWHSPPYAEALLATGRDMERACRIIDRICDFQERDPASPDYGNFYAVAEWGRVRDANAVSFLSLALGEIWVRYRDRLPARLRRRLLETLDLAAVGLVRRKADGFYTNIYLFGIAGKLLLGRILDRPDLLRLAETLWESFLDRTSRENISEYNSPSYSAIHLECLLAIREYATGKRMRRQAAAALEYFLSLLCLYYHRPSRAHTGTTARAYRDSLLTLESATLEPLYVLFSEPRPADELRPFPALSLAGNPAFARYDYLPPARLRQLFRHKPPALRIDERTVCYWGRDFDPKIVERACDQTALYSLATQYGVWASYGHYLPFLLVHAGDGERRSMFFQNEPMYPLIDAWFRQDSAAALGAFFWGLHDYAEFRQWWHEPPFEAKQVCHLGRRSELRALLLDGREWNGRRQPRAGSTVVVAKSEIEVRIRLLEPPSGTRTPELRMHEHKGDVVIHLTYARSASADGFLRAAPCAQPVLFEVRPASGGRPWPETAVRMSERRGVLRLACGRLSAKVPLTLAARDRLAAETDPPLEHPLVEAPGYTRTTADLRRAFELD